MGIGLGIGLGGLGVDSRGQGFDSGIDGEGGAAGGGQEGLVNMLRLQLSKMQEEMQVLRQKGKIARNVINGDETDEDCSEDSCDNKNKPLKDNIEQKGQRDEMKQKLKNIKSHKRSPIKSRGERNESLSIANGTTEEEVVQLAAVVTELESRLMKVLRVAGDAAQTLQVRSRSELSLKGVNCY
jgi:septum formation inhibitor MinC